VYFKEVTGNNIIIYREG